MRKNRRCNCGWWALALLVVLMKPADCESGVGIMSGLQQLITSSTLQWVTPKQDASFDHYVIGAKTESGPIYLCRARHDGDWLLGQLRPGYKECIVSFDNVNHDHFEVLENIDNGSFIYWESWSKFRQRPKGAVAADLAIDNVFIGRIKADNGFTHYIGKIVYESAIGQLIALNDENEELIKDEGEILVELEPLSYKLSKIELALDKQKISQEEPIIIEERVLMNDGFTAGSVIAEIEYQYNYSLYWGHGRGIAIGLNTTIEMGDGTVLPPIKWANSVKEERKDLFKLEQYLEPGTACNVTIRGNKTNRDVMYTGKLVTMYAKNQQRSRVLKGERIEETMEVEAIYSDAYFIANNSFVPTTTTTTTTTTSTTTPPTLPPEVNIIGPEDLADMTNEPDNGEISVMQSDDIAKPLAKEDTIRQAAVGGLGNPNEANTRIASFIASLISICITMFL